MIQRKQDNAIITLYFNLAKPPIFISTQLNTTNEIREYKTLLAQNRRDKITELLSEFIQRPATRQPYFLRIFPPIENDA